MMIMPLLAIFAIFVRLEAQAGIARCDDCYCITWQSGGDVWIEVRCPVDDTGRVVGTPGWRKGDQPADGSSGSMGGDGSQKEAPPTLPGMPLSGTDKQLTDQAKSAATVKLRGTRIEDMKGVFEPNQCTELFDNSPLNMRGLDLLDYVIFRNGTGVRDPNDSSRVPCTTFAAWTTCCTHDRVVYVCPSNFNSMSRDARTAVLIHELLHVAGQREDLTNTSGPDDPPTTSQIQTIVKNACGL